MMQAFKSYNWFSQGFPMILKQFWAQKPKRTYVRHSDNFFLTKYGILTNYNFDIFTHISYNFWLTQTYYSSFSNSEIVELMISSTKSSSSYGFLATVQNISLIFFGSDFSFRGFLLFGTPYFSPCFQLSAVKDREVY